MDMLDWPDQIDWQPWCRATRPEEHAVSRDMLGPCRSKKCDMRLAMKVDVLVVM